MSKCCISASQAIPLWPLRLALVTGSNCKLWPYLAPDDSYLIAIELDGFTAKTLYIKANKLGSQMLNLWLYISEILQWRKDKTFVLICLLLLLWFHYLKPSSTFWCPMSILTFDSSQCFKASALCPLSFDPSEVYLYNYPCHYQMCICGGLKGRGLNSVQ